MNALKADKRYTFFRFILLFSEAHSEKTGYNYTIVVFSNYYSEYNMKKIIFLQLMILTWYSNAQDTIPESFPSDILSKTLAEKFSVARIANFQYEKRTSHNFDTEFLGQDLGERRITDNNRIKANFNIPVIMKKQNKLTYSLFYDYEGFTVSNPENESIHKNVDLHYISSIVSYTFFSTLFKKPIIYNGSLIVDGSQKNIERVKPMASAVLVLKRTDKTTMTAGLVGFYDPTSRIPVFPVFTYSHRFDNNLRLDIILPQRILLQTRVAKSGRLSLGSELNSTNYYIRSKEIVPYADKFEFRQIEAKSGLAYEYLIKNSIVLTAKTGIMNVLSSRLSKRGESFTDDHYIMKFRPKASAYFNLGVSFNPF